MANRWNAVQFIATALLAVVFVTPFVHAQTVATDDLAERVVKPNDVDPRVAVLAARRVTVNVHQVALSEALAAIAEQAHLKLMFDQLLVADAPRVTVQVRNVTASSAFRLVLRGQELHVVISPSGQVALVRGAGDEHDDLGTVTGTVTDATGHPVPGATVTLQKTNRSVLTDNRGRYTLAEVTPGTWTISIRRLGYEPVTKTVVVRAGASISADVSLVTRIATLDQVVTTATGDKRRVEVGNQITTLNVDSLLKTGPITSITDLLISRVPGLTTQRSTGAPGDPTRLRLRGVSSLAGNNDPIVIVDGVRMYAVQTEKQSANLTSLGSSSNDLGGGLTTSLPIPAPSPLDRVDVNTIEKIEVLNGPSAATMYGSDAANGVIVITTKRGQAGPTRWTASAARGTSNIPYRFPDSYIRWGHSAGSNNPIACPITNGASCIPDSVSVYNALEEPLLSPLGHGATGAYTLGASGGTQTFQYTMTGSYTDDIGVLKLPPRAYDQYRALLGTSPPGWMRRPMQFKTVAGGAGLTIQANPLLSIALRSDINKSDQSRSSLESTIESLRNQPFDPKGDDNLFLPDFYKQTTAGATDTRNSMQANWQGRPWLTLSSDAGWNVQNRDDREYVPFGVSSAGTDSGTYAIGRGTTSTGTLNGRISARAPALFGIQLTTTVGVNYVRTSQDNVITHATGMNKGTRSFDYPAVIYATNTEASGATYGVYIEPTFNLWNRLYLSPGIRFDGGTNFGSATKTFTMPKLSTSWLVSNERFFPFKSTINSARVRVSYGQAGTQPSATGRLRTYRDQGAYVDGQPVDGLMVASLGNTELRPERGSELEYGLDLDAFDSRFSVGMTAYRKTLRDALVMVPVALSVGVGSFTQAQVNIGTTKNSGVELSMTAEPIRTRLVDWSVTANYGRNRNMLVSLAKNQLLKYSTAFTGESRYVAGYPMGSLWTQPMIGYADVNGDGVIQYSEVTMGDSVKYVGAPYPKFSGGFGTSLQLFNSAVSINSQFSYTNGATQVNGAMRAARDRSQLLTNPNASLAAQAYSISMDYYDYAMLQTVSTLRWESLSIGFRLPQIVTRRLRASAAQISVQGSNLGLHSNYRGLDPNANAYASEVSGSIDAGFLPAPRTWRLALNLNY